MRDALRTLLLAAIGAIELTDAAVRSMTDDLVQRGQLAIDDARELVALWSARRAAQPDATADRIQAEVLDALGRMNVAAHESVVALEARVATLERDVERLAAAGARAAG
jgi:polyhydroxyalkanoate synthesis regulator phasin